MGLPVVLPAPHARGRWGWRDRLHRVLGLLVAAVGVLVTGLLVAPAASAEAPGVVLTVDQDGRFGLRNDGDEPCRTSELLDGTVTIVAVTREGQPVQPVLRWVHYVDGLAAARATAEVELHAGGSQPLTLAAPLPAGRWLAAVADAGSSGALLITYPLDDQGPTEVTAVLNGEAAAACAGDLAPVTAVVIPAGAAAPATPGAAPVWVWVLVAGATVVVGVVGWLVVRSRRRKATQAVVVFIGAVALLFAPPPIPAEATIEVSPGSHAGFKKAVDSCLGRIFDAGDPGGAFVRAANAKHKVTIQEGVFDSSTTPDSLGDAADPKRGSPSVINWNPKNTAPYADGVLRDGCAVLYHELSHGADAATGTDNGRECGSTGISVAEVKATFAENAYREAHDLPKRQAYGGKVLPAKLADCTKQPGKPSRGPRHDECRPESCGSANGDPHLRTFDQLRYDLQTVGEYMLTRGTDDGFAVQVRQAAFPGSRTVSVVTAAAITATGDPDSTVQVTVDERGRLHAAVGGRPVALGTDERPVADGLTGIIEATDRGDAFAFATPDGTDVIVNPLGRWGVEVEVAPSQTRAGRLAGLLGNFDGTPGNDLSGPDGEGPTGVESPVDPATARGVLDGWRIDQELSLLPYPAGTTTEDFTDRSFPDADVQVSDAAAAAARAICAQTMDPGSPEFDACVVDVAVTGLVVFAHAAADRATTAPDGPAGPGTSSGTAVPTSTSPAGPPPPDAPVTDPNALPVPAGAIAVAPGDRAALPADGALLLSGELADADQVDVLQVDATAGQVAYLQTQGLAEGCQGLFDHRVTLLAPSGATAASGWDCAEDPRRVVFQEAGTYRLEVRGDDRPDGRYRVALLDSGPDQDFPLVLDTPVGPDRPSAGAGRLERPGTVDRYAFTAAAGQVVYLAVEGVNQCDPESGLFTQQITVTSPSGAVISTGWTCAGDPGRVALPEEGDYTVTVSGDAARTGEYGFVLRDAGPDGLFDVALPTQIGPGTPGPGAGRIERPGSQDSYRFAAAAGQQLVLTSDGPWCTSAWSPTARVFGPDGGQLSAIVLCTGPTALIQLPQDGTYTVSVLADSPDTGDYQLGLTVE